MEEEDEGEMDNEQGDNNGDGDAELVVAAEKKKKVRKEKLSRKSWKKHKKIMLFGIRGYRSSRNENQQHKTLSQVPLRTTATW